MEKAIKELFDLTGKVAIVTGGAMGIGKGVAIRLAQAGASILIADIVPEEEAEETLRELKALGARVEYLQVDLSVTDNLPKVIDRVLDAFDDLDILVNNAGIYSFVSVTELSETLWDKTLNLNLKSVAFLSKLAVNTMIEKNHGGRIINISSVDGIKPTGNLAQYDASKGGVRMLTKAFAKECGKYNINVNDIAPGGISTPGVEKINQEVSTSGEKGETATVDTNEFIKKLPIQRMGEPEEIGNAVLFLAGNASNYITGSTFVIDGGLMLV